MLFDMNPVFDWSCLNWTVCGDLIGVLKFSIMFYSNVNINFLL